MYSRLLRMAFLPAAIIIMAGSTAFAGEMADTGRRGDKGEVVEAKRTVTKTKRFHVTALEGDIAPNTLRVKMGQKVKITFVSRDSSYSIKMKDFGIKAKVSQKKPVVVEFIADKKGTFEFRCARTFGIKRYRKSQMNGTIIVE